MSQCIATILFFFFTTKIITGNQDGVGRKSTQSKDVNSFIDLVENGDVFVDKTRFIETFLKVLQGNLHLTFPPKWGKTTILHMLESFLSIQVDEKGTAVTPNCTTAHKFFVHGETTSGRKIKFEISENKDTIDAHLAQHPVIYVSFAEVSSSDSFAGIKRALAAAYKKHAYMTHVIQAEGKILKLDRFNAMLSATASELETELSLLNLVDMLEQHFSKRVYLFLDDIDKPFQSILAGNLTSVEFWKLHKLMTEILEPVFDHSNRLERSLVTSVFSLFDSRQTTMIENLVHSCGFLIDGCRDGFGFTEVDVAALFDSRGLDKMAAENAKKFYRQCIDSNPDYHQFIYSPYDVVNFLRHGKIRSYWVEAVSPTWDLFKIPGMESTLISLLSYPPDFESGWHTQEGLLQLGEASIGASNLTFAAEGYLFAMGYLALVTGKGHYTQLRSASITVSLGNKLHQHLTSP